MDIILLETHLFDPKFSSGFLFIDWIVFTNCDSGFDKLKEKNIWVTNVGVLLYTKLRVKWEGENFSNGYVIHF